MAWRLAKSLDTLRKEINAAHPNRSKASDGTIGDTAHSARKSDHNPDSQGIVRALDITHDPANGVNSHELARKLVATPDKRLKYVISNGQIASREHGWKWRPYSGSNPHKHHVHLSVMGGALGDDPAPWGIGTVSAPVKDAPAVKRVLRRGDNGEDVKRLQSLLGIDADGDFGPRTETAVKALQTRSGLTVDGIAGPATMDALE